jgi:hypothetical protein
LLTVPASAVNGAGDNSGEDNLYVPICSVRNQYSGIEILMTALGATLYKNFGGFNKFQIASLPSDSKIPINIQLNW